MVTGAWGAAAAAGRAIPSPVGTADWGRYRLSRRGDMLRPSPRMRGGHRAHKGRFFRMHGLLPRPPGLAARATARGSTAPSAGAPAGAGPPRSCSNPAELTRRTRVAWRCRRCTPTNSVTSAPYCRQWCLRRRPPRSPTTRWPPPRPATGAPPAPGGSCGCVATASRRVSLKPCSIQARKPYQAALLAAGGKSVISNHRWPGPGPQRAGLERPAALPARARRGGEAG